MPLVDDDAIAHVHDTSRCLRQIFVVRHDDDRRPVAIQALEECDHVRTGSRIELARRFVGEEQSGPIRKRARDRDALLLAARQFSRAVVASLGQADICEEFASSVAARALLHSGL
jgi:hypothetical protein